MFPFFFEVGVVFFRGFRWLVFCLFYDVLLLVFLDVWLIGKDTSKNQIAQAQTSSRDPEVCIWMFRVFFMCLLVCLFLLEMHTGHFCLIVFGWLL